MNKAELTKMTIELLIGNENEHMKVMEEIMRYSNNMNPRVIQIQEAINKIREERRKLIDSSSS